MKNKEKEADHIRQLQGTVLFHGTEKGFLEECLQKYGRAQTYFFEGEPPHTGLYMSLTSDPEEAMSYAVGNSVWHEGEGVILISPFEGAFAERYDAEVWDMEDRCMPYIYPNEFTVYEMGKVPPELAQIVNKEVDDLMVMLGDEEQDIPGIDVDQLARDLADYCTGHLKKLQTQVKKEYPEKKQLGALSGRGVLYEMEHNGSLGYRFMDEFGQF